MKGYYGSTNESKECPNCGKLLEKNSFRCFQCGFRFDIFESAENLRLKIYKWANEGYDVKEVEHTLNNLSMIDYKNFKREKNPKAAACYILTWITGFLMFVVTKDKFIRFHAVQSILTFLPLTILTNVLWWVGRPRWTAGGIYGWRSYNPGIPEFIYASWIIYIVIFFLWVVLIIKSYNGELFKIPIAGSIAEKQIK